MGGRTYSSSADPTKDQRVLDFLKDRVRIIGVKDQPMFSPAIIVHMRDGRAYQGTYPYDRMAWNFDQLMERMQDPASNFPLGRAKFDTLVQTVRTADTLPTIEPLLRVTLA